MGANPIRWNINIYQDSFSNPPTAEELVGYAEWHHAFMAIMSKAISTFSVTVNLWFDSKNDIFETLFSSLPFFIQLWDW